MKMSTRRGRRSPWHDGVGASFLDEEVTGGGWRGRMDECEHLFHAPLPAAGLMHVSERPLSFGLSDVTPTTSTDGSETLLLLRVGAATAACIYQHDRTSSHSASPSKAVGIVKGRAERTTARESPMLLLSLTNGSSQQAGLPLPPACCLAHKLPLKRLLSRSNKASCSPPFTLCSS